MPLAPDDHMVMHHDPHMPPGLGNAVGDGHIGLAGLRVAGRVVVDEDQPRRAQIQPLVDHLARVDRRLIDAAVGQMLIADQAVFGVEVQHPHPLHRQMRHIDGKVIDQRLPATQHRLGAGLRAGQPPCRHPHDMQGRRRRLAHARMARQRRRVGIEHASQRAKPLDQRACDRLGVAAGDGGHQQIFDDLVIGQRVLPAVEQPFAQPCAVARWVMAGVGFCGGLRFCGRRHG